MFSLVAPNVSLKVEGLTETVNIHSEPCFDTFNEIQLVALRLDREIFSFLSVCPKTVRKALGQEIYSSPNTVFMKAYGKSYSLLSQLRALNIVSEPVEVFAVSKNMPIHLVSINSL